MPVASAAMSDGALIVGLVLSFGNGVSGVNGVDEVKGVCVSWTAAVDTSPNFWILWLLLSATNTFPAESSSTSFGLLKLLSVVPWVPHVAKDLPFLSILEILLFPV